MDDFIEVAGFLMGFPIWTVQLRNGGFKELPHAPFAGDTAVPIFTDEHLAEQWIAHLPAADRFRPVPLESRLAFLGFLTLLHHKGIIHVLTDPTPGGKTIFKRVTEIAAEVLAGVA